MILFTISCLLKSFQIIRNSFKLLLYFWLIVPNRKLPDMLRGVLRIYGFYQRGGVIFIFIWLSIEFLLWIISSKFLLTGFSFLYPISITPSF